MWIWAIGYSSEPWETASGNFWCLVCFFLQIKKKSLSFSKWKCPTWSSPSFFFVLYTPVACVGKDVQVFYFSFCCVFCDAALVIPSLLLSLYPRGVSSVSGKLTWPDFCLFVKEPTCCRECVSSWKWPLDEDSVVKPCSFSHLLTSYLLVLYLSIGKLRVSLVFKQKTCKVVACYWTVFLYCLRFCKDKFLSRCCNYRIVQV